MASAFRSGFQPPFFCNVKQSCWVIGVRGLETKLLTPITQSRRTTSSTSLLRKPKNLPSPHFEGILDFNFNFSSIYKGAVCKS